MKLGFLQFLLMTLMLNSYGTAASWPEGPWLNSTPPNSTSPNANATSVVAFVSPYDLQFYRTLNIWKRLNKKYSDFQVNFIVVAMGEQNLPPADDLVKTIVSQYTYTLPVLQDSNSTFAKSWHAYVSPTVDLNVRDGKVITFDSGAFDPALFEKTLQRVLKDNQVPVMPAREFNNDAEGKNCGHSHTIFVGERFGKAWMPDVLSFQGPWQVKPLWIEGPLSKSAQIDMIIAKGRVGFLAQAEQIAKVTVTIDGQKIPPEVRGRDIEEKLGTTYLSIRDLKMYELISHSSRLKDNQKLTLTTENPTLKIRGIETLPSCLEVE